MVTTVKLDKFDDRTAAKDNVFIIFGPAYITDTIGETGYLDYFTSFTARLNFPIIGKGYTDFGLTKEEEFLTIIGELGTVYESSYFFDHGQTCFWIGINKEKSPVAGLFEYRDSIFVIHVETNGDTWDEWESWGDSHQSVAIFLPDFSSTHENIELVVGETIGNHFFSERIELAIFLDAKSVEGLISDKKKFVGFIGFPADGFDTREPQSFLEGKETAVGSVNHEMIGDTSYGKREDNVAAILKPRPFEVFFAVLVKEAFGERDNLAGITSTMIVENKAGFIVLFFDQGKASSFGRVRENPLSKVRGSEGVMWIVTMREDNIPKFPGDTAFDDHSFFPGSVAGSADPEHVLTWYEASNMDGIIEEPKPLFGNELAIDKDINGFRECFDGD